MAALPLLSLLIALPLVAAPLCLLAGARAARPLAIGAAALALAVSLLLVAGFNTADGGFQWLHRVPWIPGLGVDWHLGVDGLSLLFLPATCLLFLAALVAGARAPERPGVHHAAVLLLEGATLGVFSALDLLLFFLFWELTLLPAYYLATCGAAAGGRASAAVADAVAEAANRAATRYFLFMLAGGVPLLLALLLAACARGEPVTDLTALLANGLPPSVQSAVFLLFVLGFAGKVPLVPLHSWLPALALGAPATLSALVVGVKLGAYGLLRFAIPLAPQAAQELHWLLAGLGTLAVLYGAVAATAQGNLRGVIAYGSVAHVGLALLGLASFSVLGVQGVVLLLLGFPFVTGGSFLLLDSLWRRVGSTDLSALSGVRQRMPRLAAFFLLFGLAGMGMPGTIGFPAELLIVLAALQAHSGAALAALFGMVVAAGAFLGPYRSAFFGPLRAGAVAEADDLTRREFAVALLLTLPVLAIGLWPQPVFAIVRAAAEVWVARVTGGG